MASMRKLNRRVRRWRRYAEKTGWTPCWTSLATYKPATGWDRALTARWRERERRNPSWRIDTRDPWWTDELPAPATGSNPAGGEDR